MSARRKNKHRLTGILMLVAMALLAGRAGATDYAAATTGDWAMTNTWGGAGLTEASYNSPITSSITLARLRREHGASRTQKSPPPRATRCFFAAGCFFCQQFSLWALPPKGGNSYKHRKTRQ